MREQELRALQEAYNQVYELEEGMMMKDFKQQRSRQKQKDKREALKTSPTRRAGIHADKASPERAARHRANVDPDYDRDDEEDMYPGGKLKNPKKIRKAKALGELGEQVDLYDIILSHLLNEGYAETPEAAEAIMVNMGEEWRESIVEETKRTKYLQKKFNKENEGKSGSAHTYIPGKQNTGQALQKARESDRQMRGDK